MGFISLLLCIAWLVGLWRVFEKADQPGWVALVPFYNLWVLLRIGGQPWWWFIGFFIPLLNLVVLLLLSLALAKRFAQPAVFGVALFLLPFVFFPILGFSNAIRYHAPNAPGDRY